MPTTLITAARPELEDELAAAVRARQAADPLAAAHVLVGGTLLRPYLRRLLATKLDGVVNVHLVTPGELGLLLGEQQLLAQGRQPLPMLADRVFTASAAASHAGAFAAVADFPGFPNALARTLRDLRFAGASPDVIESVAASASDPNDPDALRLSSLAQLYRRTAELRGDRYGAEDALVAADPSQLESGLIVYGVWETTAVLRHALARIAGQLELTVLLPATSSATASAVAGFQRFLIEELEADRRDVAPRPAPTSTVELVTAPDPAREARQVVRQLLAWAQEGIAFHEMVIAYRDGSTYRPLLEAALREADIEVYAHEGTPLTERPLGRRILALLGLAESRDGSGNPLLARADVLAFLADARLPSEAYEDYGKPSIPRWETITRRAGVTHGLESWELRLPAYVAELHASRPADGSEIPAWVTERAASVDHLLRFVQNLAAALVERPQQGSWSGHVAWLDELLARYVGDADPVRGAIAELAQLDGMVEPTDAVGFDRAVAALLEGLRDRDVLGGRGGAFGLRGVTLVDVVSLRQLAFRAVAVVGLSERSFPPPPREDPLLLDDRRTALLRDRGLELPLRARGGDPEPLQFECALAAGSERVLASFARAGSDGRSQLPSTFFREVAERLVGRRVTAEEIDTTPLPGILRLAAGRISPVDADAAITAGERRRALLEDRAPGAIELVRHRLPRTARGAVSRDARLAPQLTAFDGLVSRDVRPTLHALPRFDRLSPTSIETYATCPQQHLLGNVLGLREIEEPEELQRLSPLDKGSAVHEILEQFMRGAPGGVQPLAAERERLRAISAAVLDALQAAGRTGYPLLWDVDRIRLEEDLDQWLEEAYARDEYVAVWPERGYEVRFGPRRHGVEPLDEDPLTRDEPLSVQLPSGRALTLNGYVDRVDYSPTSKRFVVVDYKTGRMYGKDPDELKGGQTVQLPLYVLAIAAALGTGPENGSARYESVDRKGEFRHVGFDGTLLADTPSPLVRLLDELTQSRIDGDFHREPSDIDDRGACAFCSVKDACDPRRRVLHRRKGEAEQLIAAALRKETYR